MIVVTLYLEVESLISISLFFFFNDTATTEIYTLSLHDALPIYAIISHRLGIESSTVVGNLRHHLLALYSQPYLEVPDRKSTRLNSSHANISYAVFCLKKKNNITHRNTTHTHTSVIPYYVLCSFK